jgi:subtilisin-like proprotein convertase family protein/subtilisin family serine protease
MKQSSNRLRWGIAEFFAVLTIAVFMTAFLPRSYAQETTARPQGAASALPQNPPEPGSKPSASNPASAPVAPPVAAEPVPPPGEPSPHPDFPGEHKGKPWLDIPEWKHLAPRERIVRLMRKPFGIQHSGGVQMVELAKDELYYPHVKSPKARLTRIPEQADVDGVLREAEAVRAKVGFLPRLVLYPRGTRREERSDANLLIISDEVLIETLDENAAVASAKNAGLVDAAAMTDVRGFVLGHDDRFPGSALVTAAELDSAPGVKTARALLAYNRVTKALPNDPLIDDQWHLKKSGTTKVDINVAPVWDPGVGRSFKGTGITVAVVDDGIDIAHADLATNCNTPLHYNWLGIPGTGNPPTPGNIFDPTPDMPTGKKGDEHGTSVAGLIGAEENSIGGVGVAPKVKLVGYRLVGGAQTDSDTVAAMTRDNAKINIKNNSWGGDDKADAFPYIDPLVTAALLAASTSRSGKGVIMPWSSGNGRAIGDQAGNEGYVNDIHVIPVGNLQRDGHPNPESEFGACLIVSAPGTEITSTDLTGESGLSRSFDLTGADVTAGSTQLKLPSTADVYKDFEISGSAFQSGTVADSVNDTTNTVTLSLPALATLTNGTVTIIPDDLDHYNKNTGTSFSTPIVSGVIALMLEARAAQTPVVPALSWRDVDEILLRSSQQLEPTNNDWGGWVTRDGGQPSIASKIKHHHAYGGGCVDAKAAVAMAKTWTNLANRSTSLTKQNSGLNAGIPDNNARGQQQYFDFSTDPAMRVEQVEVLVEIIHPKRGNLQIELKSPSSTVSTLKHTETRDTDPNGYNQYSFLSNRHWGESSLGRWTVTVRDLESGATGTLDEVKVTLHGVNMLPPVIQLASFPPNLFTGVALAKPIDLNIANGSTSVSITGLPAGLTYDPVTGAISGTPTQAVTAKDITITATNDAGTTTKTLKLTITTPFPKIFEGSYSGFIAPSTGFYDLGKYGGEFAMTVTPTGSFTVQAKFRGEPNNNVIAGQWQVTGPTANPTCTFPISIPDKTSTAVANIMDTVTRANAMRTITRSGTCTLTIHQSTGQLTGEFKAPNFKNQIITSTVTGYRRTAAARIGRYSWSSPYSFGQPGDVAVPGGPSGTLDVAANGAIKATLEFTGGGYRITQTLREDEMLGPNGQVELYFPCFMATYQQYHPQFKGPWYDKIITGPVALGMIRASLTISNTDTVSGTVIFKRFFPDPISSAPGFLILGATISTPTMMNTHTKHWTVAGTEPLYDDVPFCDYGYTNSNHKIRIIGKKIQ